MKIITFDSGFRLDDPNARWGDPSYVLEPGNMRLVWLGKANVDKNQNHEPGLCLLPLTFSHY
jgi:hypothetical protein